MELSRCTSPAGCNNRFLRCSQAFACKDPGLVLSTLTATRVVRGSAKDWCERFSVVERHTLSGMQIGAVHAGADTQNREAVEIWRKATSEPPLILDQGIHADEV